MIPGLGSKVEVGLAVAIYMIAFVLVTELVVPWLKLKGGKALIASWLVGGILYGVLALVGCYAVTWVSAIVFVIVTGLCNTAYKWTRLKGLIRSIVGTE